MPVFAITGSLASGKSTVLHLLQQKKGIAIFNSDERAHQYYGDKNSGVYKNLIRSFPEVFGPAGMLNRDKLGRVVFSDLTRLKELERIIHPVIIKDLQDWVKRQKKSGNISIAEIPLLFEKKLQYLFDGVIVIYTKRNILINRIKSKYGLTMSQAAKRLSLFLPIRKKLKKADFIVENNAGIEELKKETSLLWQSLRGFKNKNSIR